MSDDAHRPPPGPNGIPVSDPPVGTASWWVRSEDLAGVRRSILSTSALAGLDTERADRFILAVNEIMINAIRHAGGRAKVEVSATRPTEGRDGEITVTVTDTGAGFTHHPTPDPPPADQIHGRGLWLAHRLCDDVDINSSPHGTAVRLRATSRHR